MRVKMTTDQIAAWVAWRNQSADMRDVVISGVKRLKKAADEHPDGERLANAYKAALRVLWTMENPG